MSTVDDLVEIRDRVARHLVGRERELELVLSAVGAGRDIVLEGPPGTSKTTLLRAITTEWGIPLLFVEGNADLTPSRLIGHHNPARVLREDYSAENFVPGPLVEAMREGGFLYIEEFNRAPDDTLNTLLTAMAERQVTVPRVGTTTAKPTFRVDRLDEPVRQRRHGPAVHQHLRPALPAVGRTTRTTRPSAASWCCGPDCPRADRLVADAVAVTRATRVHPDVRQGSSVRGAIDTALVATEVSELRGVSGRDDERYPQVVFDAMTVALSGRIQLDEAAETTPELVLRQIWEDHFLLAPACRRAGLKRSAGRLAAAPAPGAAAGRPARPLRRRPKQLRAGAEPLRAGPRPAGWSSVDGPTARRRCRPAAAARPPSTPTSRRELVAVPTGGPVDRRGAGPGPADRGPARRCPGRAGTRPRARGPGEILSLPYRGGSDDIDLDRTIEVLTERPVPEEEDIVVRERYAPGARSCSRSTSPGRCAASGSAPPPRPSARWPASCSGTTSRWSRSGPTPPCCCGWARRCGRCSCSTSCSRSRPAG